MTLEVGRGVLQERWSLLCMTPTNSDAAHVKSAFSLHPQRTIATPPLAHVLQGRESQLAEQEPGLEAVEEDAADSLPGPGDIVVVLLASGCRG